MFQTWFKIFFRNQKKNWLNGVVNISGLTLGFSALLLVILYLNEEKSYNQWNPDKNTIYRVNIKQAQSGEVWFTVNPGMYLTYPKEIPEIKEALMVKPFYRSRVIQYNDVSEFNSKTITTEPIFFEFFPFKILQGSVNKFSETRNNIAISEVYSKRIFKDDDAVGNSVKINGKSYFVACVYEVPKNSHYEPDLLMQFETPFAVHWGNHNNELFCKIPEGSDLASVKEKMEQIIVNVYRRFAEEEGVSIEEFNEKFGIPTILLDKLSTIYLHNTAKRAGPSGTGNYQLIMILLGLSILLIIISCVNFINLSLASGNQRAKEVGVKKTLGFTKKSLLFQYVFEIVLQGLVSFLFALIIVELALPFFNDFMQTKISILHFKSLSILFLVVLGTSLLIGAIPALYLSNFKSIEVLKGNISKSKKGNLARNLMLGVQFLISGFFIISILIVSTQVSYMMEKDLGFDKSQVIAVDLYSIGNEYDKYKLTKEILEKQSNIIAITASMFVPGEGFVNGTALRHPINEKQFNCASNLVDYDYIKFAKLKVLKGRSFSKNIASDSINRIIINETAAKQLGIYKKPIGEKVRLGWLQDDAPSLEVIGMVKDYHFDGFDTKISPMFFTLWENFEFAKQWIPAIQFKIKPENIDVTISEIETFWKTNIDTKYPFTYEFLDKKFAKTYKKYRKEQAMFLILSIIVITIALLGLFALATLTIQQRLKEVAIRKTLGASANNIMIQLVKIFLKITLLASAVLIPTAYYFMQSWLNNFVYRINMPIWPYLLTPIILLILVFTVVGFKAFKATKIDLIKHLKFE
ncbi:putative ABC transport system permease protein [Tenacibaculum sp. MAR_2009_124]|uniref:ABC transporter permease n=1 Tax=Tenacibaculum sp. MAR_2009_124 TaxID=1250059 RepID=UPI000894D13B|nr:ABC transporter permease [Tenacibaculum sp. MAR_2009_124]SEB47845.1 putative ABC transport system permease protein [Tenacibaculum sp. MAR_2009_124]